MKTKIKITIGAKRERRGGYRAASARALVRNKSWKLSPYHEHLRRPCAPAAFARWRLRNPLEAARIEAAHLARLKEAA